MSFDTLGLIEPLLRAIHDKGYDTPTPVQLQAIPAILQGQDIMAAAQTGTGKTAGFTLPLLQRLLDGPGVKPHSVRALVLTPTRELAAQVGESVDVYGKHLDLRASVIFGGVGINPQIAALRRGVDVLVATPGRLLDLHQQNAVKFNQVQILVLDEADRMLDMGFIHDIKKILKLLPEKRQNLLFSATFSGDIRTLAKSLLNAPVEIDVSPRNAAAVTVEQVVHPVDKTRKSALLAHLIRTQHWSQAIVFSRTKHGANRLADYLMKQGISAAAIHSNKSQNARTRALSDFKQGQVAILVATDIAARGLDIPQLPQVVNFDLPNVPEDYVHRIGRTGRAGETGHAISLVCAEENRQLADIERLIKRKLPREVVSGFDATASAAETPADAPARPAPNRPAQRQEPRADNEQNRNRRRHKPRPEGPRGQNGNPQQPRQKPAPGKGQNQGQNQGQGSHQKPRDGQRPPQGGRPPAGKQRRGPATNALDFTPMARRDDSIEEHRRAQAAGNRLEPSQPEKVKEVNGNRAGANVQHPLLSGDAPPRKKLMTRIKDWAKR